MAVCEQDLEGLIWQCVPIFQRCFTHQCVREIVDEIGVARDVTSDDDRGAGSLPDPAAMHNASADLDRISGASSSRSSSRLTCGTLEENVAIRSLAASRCF